MKLNRRDCSRCDQLTMTGDSKNIAARPSHVFTCDQVKGQQHESSRAPFGKNKKIDTATLEHMQSQPNTGHNPVEVMWVWFTVGVVHCGCT